MPSEESDLFSPRAKQSYKQTTKYHDPFCLVHLLCLKKIRQLECIKGKLWTIKWESTKVIMRLDQMVWCRLSALQDDSQLFPLCSQYKLHQHHPAFSQIYSQVHIIFYMISYLTIQNFPPTEISTSSLFISDHNEVSCRYTLCQRCDCCVWKTASMPGLAEQRRTWAPDTPSRT